MPEWFDDLPEFRCDDLPEFDASDLKPLAGYEDGPDLDDATQDKVKGLDADLAFRSSRRNTYLDLLQVKAAKDHIQRLPEPGEAIHMIVSGRYPLFAIVPAVLELSGTTIDELHLITLSYSKDNAADLLGMLERGEIGRVWLLVSHYFAHANAQLYDPLAAELQRSGNHALAMRTHAKIILFKLADGRKYVVHASANLRSCKNIEQCCFEHDEQLYEFHRSWVATIFDRDTRSVAGLFDKAVEL